MKVKKLGAIIAGVALSLVLFSGYSFAETKAWAACTPKKVGHQDGFVRVKLDQCNMNITSGLGFMTLKASGEDQMMATILTAISLKQPVSIGTDWTKASGYNVATAVYLAAQ